MGKNTVKIEGHVFNNDKTLTEEQFINEFLLWLSEKNWSFVGVTDNNTDK